MPCECTWIFHPRGVRSIQGAELALPFLMACERVAGRLVILLVVFSLGAAPLGPRFHGGLLEGVLTAARARADVTLGDVTVSSDTSWAEDTYHATNVSVTGGATLSIAGGSTLYVSGTIAVSDGAIILLQGKNVSGQAEGEWRGVGVTINAANLRLDAGSAISADAQGYLAGVGPGVGGTDVDGHGGAGGGYGGSGGRAGDGFNPGGSAYGDAFAPVDLGSGGAPTRTAAGNGGGAITLNVSATLTLEGLISADGGNAVNGNCFSAPGGGGGAGGSIFITTATLTGAGAVRANGGTGGDGGCFPGVGDDGGGGAGGRIAVRYTAADDFGGFTASSVGGGVGGGHVGAPGTMVFIDTATDSLRISQHLDFAPGSSARFGAVTLEDAATLELGGGSTLTIDNDLIVSGNSKVIAQAENTAEQVGGEWRGAGVTINARNVRIDAGSSIAGDLQGYLGGAGPGAGGSDGGAHNGGGGGYGGVGGHTGDNVNAGGMAYGDAFAPADLGSGGGPTRTAAGRGGGAIALNVSETLTLEGAITANGGDGAPGNCFSAPGGGGGAGGSIFITTDTLAGAGSLHADGGRGGDGGCTGSGDDGGGGAGGRIAVAYRVNAGFGGFTSSSVDGAFGGAGYFGEPGTMVFVDTSTNALRVSQHLDFPPDAVLHFGAVTLDSGATLVLGGGTTLTIDNTLSVTESSTLSAQGKNTAAQVNGRWEGTGVTINARTVQVEAGSAIAASAQGYQGGQGPGSGGTDAGTHDGSGGGYGGIGGRGGDGFNAGGATYGAAFAPVDLGSGGGLADSVAGTGGGAITLHVLDTLMLNGVITANGGNAGGVGCSRAGSGGGSGGSVFITTARLQGTGAVSADGGAGGEGGCTGPGDDGGGGAGGRIAVLYSVDDGFAGFTTSSVSGGIGGGGAAPPGTMVFLNTTTNALRISQHLEFPPDSSVTFGAVTIDDHATLTLGGGVTLASESDFVVTENSSVFALGKNTDGTVNGRWDGTGVTISASNLRVDAGSRISADEQGYLGGLGPGVGGADGAHGGGGGGYGGVGGNNGDDFNAGGPTYGRASTPIDLGSGGGVAHSVAGSGGGAVMLRVRDTLTLDGVITARGTNAGSVGCSRAGSGGGAGGSILLVATTLAGAGSMNADGGGGGEGGCTGSGDDGGGGGGGRVAVYYSVDDGFAGFTTSTVNGGFGGRPGATGTILFITCGGDCDGDGQVTIDELIRMVNVALEGSSVLACLAGDSDRDAAIVVNEIVNAVNNALDGCPA